MTWEDKKGWTFFLLVVLLWIMDSVHNYGFCPEARLKLKCINDGIVTYTNMPLFTLQDVNWLPGVMCFTCGLLLCFFIMFYILTAPIHCRGSIGEQWCNAKFLQICSNELTNSSTSWMAWGRVNFQLLKGSSDAKFTLQVVWT